MYIFSFLTYILYMYNCGVVLLQVEEERTTDSVLRPFVHLKNSLITKRIQVKERDEEEGTQQV